ncbi:uncharacterized protein LOC111628968 [Centruroides sculpturatus]|uniref:uncharacterized protein LOC111628968 n=1 Tax=Centruroides sculpturatus TaxID=218467 RepID=UPI000C6D1696|nr:uncharacterized protein LOC111628968 [Centruroides sculpturatus]
MMTEEIDTTFLTEQSMLSSDDDESWDASIIQSEGKLHLFSQIEPELPPPRCSTLILREGGFDFDELIRNCDAYWAEFSPSDLDYIKYSDYIEEKQEKTNPPFKNVLLLSLLTLFSTMPKDLCDKLQRALQRLELKYNVEYLKRKYNNLLKLKQKRQNLISESKNDQDNPSTSANVE